MPPKQTAGSRGRPLKAARGGPKSKSKATATTSNSRGTTSSRAPQQTGSDDSDDPFADSLPEAEQMQVDEGTVMAEEGLGEEEDEEELKTIPPELLTRLLHEFFEKDSTRISKDANKAAAKYMDVFVREAIARTAVEKGSGFLEVEDLEKVAPQLLLDF